MNAHAACTHQLGATTGRIALGSDRRYTLSICRARSRNWNGASARDDNDTAVAKALAGPFLGSWVSIVGHRLNNQSSVDGHGITADSVQLDSPDGGDEISLLSRQQSNAG